jgi:hypothetical protein
MPPSPRSRTNNAQRPRVWTAGAVGAGFVFILAPAGAHAAGNAQVVDDTAVEVPGTCHVESWASMGRRHTGLLNLGMGCTPDRVPWLELGLAVQQSWRRGGHDTTLTPGFKADLGTLTQGVTIALTGAATLGLTSGHAETASVSIPVTIQIDPSLQLNLNAGLEWSRDGVAHRGLFGGQLMWSASPEVSLMVEGFGRSDGVSGYQAGVRWTPVSWFDVDLLAGELLYLPGVAVTVGLTARM